jgi:arylformamidase
MSPRTRLIDLSHVIENGMVTYKGLPAPIICDYLSYDASHAHYADGIEFNIGRIDMVANTGTYLDAPMHRWRDGRDVADLELGQVAGLPGVVVPATERSGPGIDSRFFEDVDVTGKAVLVRTGWAAHWRTDAYFEGHPYLTRDAAELLRDRKAVLVGIDSFNIDDVSDLTRPVHSTLLRAGILICEHMRGLEQLPASGFAFYAVPVKVRGFGTFPVRAFAEVVER